MNNNTLTPEFILREIEKYTNTDVSLIDAIVYYAEQHDIEIELLGDIIRRSVVLKSKVRDDAERLNLLEEKTAKLPL
jgi:hypothetical protein